MSNNINNAVNEYEDDIKSVDTFSSDSSSIGYTSYNMKENKNKKVGNISRFSSFDEWPIRKKKMAWITDFVCSMIEYIVFIPTLVYNIFWVFYLEAFILDNSNQNSCFDLIRWKGFVLTWTKVTLTKAIIFLATSKLCCGNENDLNIFCIFLKGITSWIPSLVFVFKIPPAMELYVNETRKLIYQDDIIKKCDDLKDALLVFNKFESWFCKFFIGSIAFVFIGTGLAALKEIWKSRGYKIR